MRLAVVTDDAGWDAAVDVQGAESARAAWGTELLVLEADDEGPALALYQRLGLAPIERRAGLGQPTWEPVRP